MFCCDDNMVGGHGRCVIGPKGRRGRWRVPIIVGRKRDRQTHNARANRLAHSSDETAVRFRRSARDVLCRGPAASVPESDAAGGGGRLCAPGAPSPADAPDGVAQPPPSDGGEARPETAAPGRAGHGGRGGYRVLCAAGAGQRQGRRPSGGPAPRGHGAGRDGARRGRLPQPRRYPAPRALPFGWPERARALDGPGHDDPVIVALNHGDAATGDAALGDCPAAYRPLTCCNRRSDGGADAAAA